MSKYSALLAAACLCALGSVSATEAAAHRRPAHRRPAHKQRRVHGLASPNPIAPADGAQFQQVPPLSWSAVGGAAEYEYQLSADPRFDSIVLGAGLGTGSSTTHNQAATLSKSISDGTYYWRVRGLTAAHEPGAWSRTRTFVKAWTEAPHLVGPADGSSIVWPSVPLVLRWTPVAYATEYIVTIATDPALSNVVLGSTASPAKTDASVFALPGTLPAGQYYWAITPVDAQGHRGTRSSVATFNWSWPTTTTPQVNNLNPDPRVFDPQFSWAPVPGAASYEVEVNSSSEFPIGSRWCCTNLTTGTSLSPTQVLANNGYYWRVRAIDASGNAGAWNVGPAFTKAFDSVTPTIPNLTMSDANGNPLPADPTTNTPIVTWSPVPGAASYEVQVTHYVAEFGCNWAASSSTEKQVVETSSLAWTPLGPDSTRIGPSAWPYPITRPQLTEGNTSYCVRVLARSDNDARGNQVVSDWTQIGGVNQPAFTFASQPPPGTPGPGGLETPASAYLLPAAGSTSPRTPMFTWQRVPGASSYYVVIARDSGFTHVIDVASSIVPAYAPPLGGEEPLDDQTSSYYWAVVPVNSKGEVFSDPSQGQDAPQSFSKSSLAPTPIAPINGVDVANQPSFSWTPAEGALNYTLQVSENPTFGSPIDNVRTDSTAYTSSSTYPADTTLYWRVRANDANRSNEGLNWSAVQTFRRTLPVPSPAAGNPTGGLEAIPVLSWTPLTGAIAYEVHVEQPDGTTKDFTFDSTSFTPTEWYGTGIWRWQVRAAFPANGSSSVHGGYFAPQPLVHALPPPTDATGVKSGGRVVISWNPDPYAKEYEVDVATRDTFTSGSSIETRRIEQTSWAPDIDPTRPANRGTLFWRVAAVDKRGNVGPFASGSFGSPPRKAPCVVKKVKRKNKRKAVRECVASTHKHKKAKRKRHG
jgi:hypothetical protein